MCKPPPVALVMCLTVLLLGCASSMANPNPNDIAYRYERFTKNAGRSALPQPREVFAEPLAFETETELTPPIPESGVVRWQDAGKYLDADPITVEGTIVDTYQIRDVVCRLNFTPYVQGQPAFYVAVFKEAYEGLDAPPAEYFLNKKIRVTGQVTAHRNQPNLEINDLDDIEIIGGE